MLAAAMKKEAFVIGVDFGTDSVRSVLVDTYNGTEISSSVSYYPRWRDGLFCEPGNHQFRQHPLDYMEGLENSIRDCLVQAGSGAAEGVVAISADTTGSTPVAVNPNGIPLALLPGFEKNPNAMFVLWKDHTALKEARQINEHGIQWKQDYLCFVGGIYSSEWFWAKLLHILREDEKIRKDCFSWVEHCDWIPFLLTGGSQAREMKRSICAAGHKALWSETFGGLPPNSFFSSLDPLLDGFTERLFTRTYSSDQKAGNLSAHWAGKLGLSTSVAVGVGAFDAHMGAVGGQIEPYHLSKVMGTSTCDMLVAPMEEFGDKLIRGICGQVPGSIIPGMMGMEAGQSAFGDSYAWFKNLISWPLQELLNQSAEFEPAKIKKLESETADRILLELGRKAAALPFEEHGELALDWLNGRRSPDADQSLKSAVTGLHLGTDAPRFFKSIVESTCFGARAIVDRFTQESMPVKGLIGMGGVAKKSAFIMQMMADVIGMPIRIHKSDQTCALGAAMFAATAAGRYPRVEEAMDAMGKGFAEEYAPDLQRHADYTKRYHRYLQLGRFVESN
jgi:L-ribulokinase